MPDEAIAVDENAVSFEAFKEEWLAEVREGAPSTVELGRRFAWKIVQNRFNLGQSDDEEEEGVFYCDGSNDGGIDLAYLDRGDAATPDDAATGHVWYLVQSKYGQSYQGPQTLLAESMKVFDALDGVNTKLSSLSQTVVDLLQNFKRNASDQDRIVLLFATENPLDDMATRNMLDAILTIGKQRIGELFDVQTTSIENIYRDTTNTNPPQNLTQVAISGNLLTSADGKLLAGTVPLVDLYAFLKTFKSKTGDLDQLYEKNVRRFLGLRGGANSVNKQMQATLDETPELFGLYNNGVTIVVQDLEAQIGSYLLTDPYVVNGCQTTRTIYETLRPKLDAGGTGAAVTADTDAWRAQLHQGVVIVKIVKVGAYGEELLQKITRFTNKQNAISDKDFLALDAQLRGWAKAMDSVYSIFLEIQKGGWDSQKALQKQKPKIKQYKQEQYANAFDLLKVYGAGWLSEAGSAWVQNKAFLPGGSIFQRIVKPREGDKPFSTEDLYAAFLLQNKANEYKFGRSADLISRKLTRFLFYFAAVELLRRATCAADLGCSPKTLTRAFLTLSQPENLPLRDAITNSAVKLVDAYLNENKGNNVFKEANYQGNLNGFLKSSDLGRTQEYAPNLHQLIGIYEASLDNDDTLQAVTAALCA